MYTIKKKPLEEQLLEIGNTLSPQRSRMKDLSSYLGLSLAALFRPLMRIIKLL